MVAKKHLVSTAGSLMLCLLFLMPLVMANRPVTTTITATQNDIVFTHIPANGLYWNSKKIANFPVAYFLRDKGGVLTDMGGSVTGTNIDRVELWAEGQLMMSFTAPPYSWDIHPGPHLVMFSHTMPLTAIVYLTTGGTVWDNMTIYRLF